MLSITHDSGVGRYFSMGMLTLPDTHPRHTCPYTRPHTSRYTCPYTCPHTLTYNAHMLIHRYPHIYIYTYTPKHKYTYTYIHVLTTPTFLHTLMATLMHHEQDSHTYTSIPGLFFLLPQIGLRTRLPWTIYNEP